MGSYCDSIGCSPQPSLPLQFAAAPPMTLMPPPPPSSVAAPLRQAAPFVYLVPINRAVISGSGYFLVQDPAFLTGQPPKVIPAPAALTQMDDLMTRSLLKYIADGGVYPSPEEEMLRRRVINHLRTIASAWIKKVAQKKCLSNVVRNTYATVLVYGSYGLGVHGPGSDIDAVCISPYFASLEEDFFILLRNMLERRSDVSEIHCVKTAKVPLMRFKFKGILIDFTYSQLPSNSVYDVDIFNPSLSAMINETSWRSLSGVRANKCILQLVPDMQTFQFSLRCIKLWAKKRGVMGHLFGFFGGIHLAILSAYICQRHPNASVTILMLSFFETFSQWPWPQPVILQDQFAELRVPEWSLMPIMMPYSPHEWCYSIITKSTYKKIISELQRGYDLFWFQDPRCWEFRWDRVFEAYPYATAYSCFLRILLVAPCDDELQPWVGWVKSRLRFLLLKVESLELYCDPNPTEYIYSNIVQANTVFNWGLLPDGRDIIDINSLQDDFSKCVYTDSSQYRNTKCKLELSIVEVSRLPKNMDLDARITE